MPAQASQVTGVDQALGSLAKTGSDSTMGLAAAGLGTVALGSVAIALSRRGRETQIAEETE